MNRQSLSQYLVATIVALILFLILSEYLFLRRGYYTLYIANKALAGASLMSVGIILLLGPLSRLYQVFDKWIIYRKELGIVAFFFALLHSIISFFFLGDRFPTAYFFGQNLLPFIFGLGSLIILFFLFVISLPNIVARIEKLRWWRWQYWGIRVAALLLFFHLVVLKFPGWVRWLTAGGGEELARPFLPPASLIVGSFGFYVLLVRLAEVINRRFASLLVGMIFIILVVFWLGAYFWGKNKTPTALPLKWKACLRLPGSTILESHPRKCVASDGRIAVEQLPEVIVK